MLVRKIKSHEVGHLSEIVKLNYSKKYQHLVEKELESMFKNYVNKPQYFLAEDKGKILGFAGYNQSWISYHIYEIFWVNVHPKYQKQGIGKMLIKKLLKEIKSKKGENKANMILLTATSPDYYKKFGFKIIKEFRKKDYLMALSIKQK